jgi:hypothetical protein
MTRLPGTPLGSVPSRVSIHRLSRKFVAQSRLKSASSDCSVCSLNGTHVPSPGRLNGVWM